MTVSPSLIYASVTDIASSVVFVIRFISAYNTEKIKVFQITGLMSLEIDLDIYYASVEEVYDAFFYIVLEIIVVVYLMAVS